MGIDNFGRRQKIDPVAGVLLATIVLVGCSRVSQRPPQTDTLRQPMAAGGMRMPDPAQMEAQMLDNLARQLSLSEDQKRKIGAIQREIRQKMPPPSPGSLPNQQMMAKMQAARQETDRRIKAVLTPEQAAKFEKMQAEMRQRMAQMRGRMMGNQQGTGNGMGPGGPMDGGPPGQGGPPGGGVPPMGMMPPPDGGPPMGMMPPPGGGPPRSGGMPPQNGAMPGGPNGNPGAPPR